MKPSHVQLKRQKRRENRRKSREKRRLWNLSNESHKKATDTSLKSFPVEKTELVQETTQTFVSGDKSKREMMDRKRKKKEMKHPKLKQASPSDTNKTIKSPPKAKKLKDKGKLLAEKPTNNGSTTGQDSKQNNRSEKRPLSQGKEKPTLAKRLKTKKLDEKHGVSTVSGSGLTARFDFSSPQKLFESIISPVTYKQFFAEYWEKKPLIAKRNDAAVSEAYKALFSRDVLKKLLKKHDIEYIRDVNVCRYVSGKRESLNGTERATCKQIDKLFDQSKATLQFHQPQRFQDKLWQLCSLLECLFGCLVGANVYITPPGSQGLAPHYDDVEVFILQLEGRKHWRLYMPPVDLPRDYSRDLEQDSIGQPTHDFVLEAGDMLYFPRGTVHQADTTAGSPHSTHVTISTYQHNSYGDLLSSALPMLVQTVMDRDVGFRKGLPVGALSTVGIPSMGQNNQDMRSHLQKLLVSLADQVASSSSPLLAPDVLQDFMSNRLPPYFKDTSEPLASPKGAPPNLNSFVKMRFPGYMALCLQTAEETDDDDEENDDDEDSDANGDKEEGEDNDNENDDDEKDNEEEREEADMEMSTMSAAADASDPEWVYLYHCLHNRREEHMMGSSSGQPQGLKFPAKYLPVLQKLLRMREDDRVQVKGLGLESEEDDLQVATYLWAEGLVQIC